MLRTAADCIDVEFPELGARNILANSIMSRSLNNLKEETATVELSFDLDKFMRTPSETFKIHWMLQ